MRSHIVHDHCNGTQKIGAEVGDRVADNILRRAHPVQDLRGQNHAHNRQHRPGGQAQRHRGVDGFFQALPVLCAKVAGNQHTGTQRYAVHKAGQEENQAAGRTNCRQRLAAQKVAHNQRVCRVVQLLEQIADKNRDRKQQHAARYTAFGQRIALVLLCHLVLLRS